MKLKVISSGIEGWQLAVVDATSGEQLDDVFAVSWEADIGGDIVTTIKLYSVQLEVGKQAYADAMNKKP